MKPLFLPLKTEYFRAFENGTKDIEYRRYGPRWNDRTLLAGRAVTLSHGYSGERIAAELISFTVIYAGEINSTLYPHDIPLAAIRLRIIG